MINSILIYTIVITLGIIFYLPALWARHAWSGKSFTTIRFWGTNLYNIFFGYLHMRFIEKNELPFYGYQDSSILGWFSIVMILAHACAHTVTWDIKPWFSRKTRY